MSFIYDPRTKQPQVWTYPVFVILTVAVFYAFYAYGEKKSRERVVVQENVESDRTY